jgi:hypothetical protein
MKQRVRSSALAATVFAAALPLAACTVDVRNGEPGGNAEVDVKTPVGNVSVRTDVDARDTGLTVYPGARPLRNDDDTPESANVSVGGPWFGVTVVAATFESADAPAKVVEFYEEEMRSHGEVVVCRGEADLDGDRFECDENASGEVQLVVGREDRHRMVHVEPRGSGSKLALVYVDAESK